VSPASSEKNKKKKKAEQEKEEEEEEEEERRLFTSPVLEEGNARWRHSIALLECR